MRDDSCFVGSLPATPSTQETRPSAIDIPSLRPSATAAGYCNTHSEETLRQHHMAVTNMRIFHYAQPAEGIC